jgi:hypothetical protein
MISLVIKRSLLPKEAKVDNFYRVEMFENSRGSYTVLKINTVTNTVTDFAEFADKNSATSFYFYQLEGKAIKL